MHPSEMTLLILSYRFHEPNRMRALLATALFGTVALAATASDECEAHCRRDCMEVTSDRFDDYGNFGGGRDPVGSEAYSSPLLNFCYRLEAIVKNARGRWDELPWARGEALESD